MKHVIAFLQSIIGYAFKAFFVLWTALIVFLWMTDPWGDAFSFLMAFAVWFSGVVMVGFIMAGIEIWMRKHSQRHDLNER